MRKLPLLVIEWEDIETDTEWHGEHEVVISHKEPYRSVGWRVKSNKKTLQISPMRDPYGKCSDRQIIPRGCIKSIRRLE